MTRRHDHYSSDTSDKYEYGVDHHNDVKENTGKRWSFHGNKFRKNEAQVQRSSRSLGALEVNGRLDRLIESDEFNASELDERDDEDDDASEDAKFIQRKFSMQPLLAIDDAKDDESESSNGLQELDRACVRLDGIEVYAIVSALTCATSISCFDNYNPTPLSVILKERAIFTVLAELFYYATGAVGMMTGLHATLIFSLVTMYGRTAVGIDRDDAFNSFFANTGPQRFNGFRSFKISLYCFMTQLTFLIGQKFFFEPLRPLVLLLTAYMAYTNIYIDSEQVLSAASVIYSTPPPPTPPPEEELDNPADRRAALGTMKRRASVKNKSFSISTRNFGVDTSGQRRSSFIFGGPLNTNSSG